MTKFVAEYNEVRLHSALGYIAPLDKLHGREKAIFALRDKRLEEAREKRAAARRRLREGKRCYAKSTWPEDRATVGTDPSAVPGLEAGEGAASQGTAPPPSCFEANALNPRGSGGLVPLS